MPLKSADVKVTGTAAKENGGEVMPIVTIPSISTKDKAGKAQTRHPVEIYNDAAAAKKKADAEMKEMRPKLAEPGSLGIQALFEENCAHPLEPITSVKLTDASGAVCRMSFTARYGAAEAEQVSAVFDATGQDINEYVVETVAAKFDNAVFLDAEGNFDKNVYDKFRIAIGKVAKELGVVCPLATTKVVVVKPDFHERRWKDFTVAQQKEISAVLPNTVSLTPVVA